MRRAIPILFVLLALTISVIGGVDARQADRKEVDVRGGRPEATPAFSPRVNAGTSSQNSLAGDYLFVGGQNGTWFQTGQFPLLYRIVPQTNSSIQLVPVRSGGTVWGGGFNGSQWLVSGWGSDDDSLGPYIWLYNGAHVVTAGSLDDYGEASSWNGGDIFAASYNGKEWLLTGLGSGPFGSFDNRPVNHMSLGTFNGTFTDLSYLVPDQTDAILYTNAWNGEYWLVGGGFLSDGVLFTFDGIKIVDLTAQARSAIANFGSVQSVAWNGDYWLIGGVGFLAEYDGHKFVDLTPLLGGELSNTNTTFNSVNAIAWNGESWLIGGGEPVAQIGQSSAWLASYGSAGLVDLSSILPSYITKNTQGSSLLAISSANGVWFLGGYSGNRGVLLAYNEGSLTDYSVLVPRLTYVDWTSSAILGGLWIDSSATCPLGSRLQCGLQ